MLRKEILVCVHLPPLLKKLIWEGDVNVEAVLIIFRTLCGVPGMFGTYVTLHGKTVTKVNARTRHGRTIKQKKRVSTRWLRVTHFPH